MDIRRTVAAMLIENIREILLEQDPAIAMDKIRNIFFYYGIPELNSCPGEAHSNSQIDHCGVCAPRWGFLGEKIKVK